MAIVFTSIIYNMIITIDEERVLSETMILGPLFTYE
jgi:hypothetical protein